MWQKEKKIMKLKKITGMVLVAAMAVGVMTGCGSSSDKDKSTSNTDSTKDSGKLSGTVSTNGSTSMENVIAALIESFNSKNPDVTITYDATGSGTGITAAQEGSADIGLASRDLKDDEKGLDETVIALDGIAVIVNNKNSVKNLTLAQIADIATGKVKNWKEVGGDDSPVAVIGREAGSGTRDGFESIVDVSDKCVYDQELTSTGAVIAAVSSNENAIGYASLSAVSDEIKTVTVDDVECSEDTILDGTYKIQRPFAMITNSSSKPSEAAQAFIDYAKSDEVADIISEAGAVPASKQ